MMCQMYQNDLFRSILLIPPHGSKNKELKLTMVVLISAPREVLRVELLNSRHEHKKVLGSLAKLNFLETSYHYFLLFQLLGNRIQDGGRNYLSTDLLPRNVK